MKFQKILSLMIITLLLWSCGGDDGTVNPSPPTPPENNDPDNDGFVGTLDMCPSVSGQYDGCPILVAGTSTTNVPPNNCQETSFTMTGSVATGADGTYQYKCFAENLDTDEITESNFKSTPNFTVEAEPGMHLKTWIRVYDFDTEQNADYESHTFYIKNPVTSTIIGTVSMIDPIDNNGIVTDGNIDWAHTWDSGDVRFQIDIDNGNMVVETDAFSLDVSNLTSGEHSVVITAINVENPQESASATFLFKTP